MTREWSEGWIEHDGREPALHPETVVQVKFRDGIQAAERGNAVGFWSSDDSNWTHSSPGGIVAYRVIRPHAEEKAPEAKPVDPNAAMIARDGKPATFEDRVAALAGNGCIFAALRVERCNLLVVADIPTTGFSVWGEQS